MLEPIFTPEQIAQLETAIDAKRVAHRQGGGGSTLSYIEGHEAIDAANRIFSYGNWGFEIVGTPTRDHYTDTNGEIKAMWYTAKVRLHVRGCEPIEEMGLVEVQLPKPGRESSFGQQVDVAMKGAITDALKRALRCYGDQFGNSLYDKALVDGQEKTVNQPTAPANQNRPTAPTRPVATQQPSQPDNRPTPAQPASTPTKPVTPSPIQAAPAPTKKTFEVLGLATYGCPRCDGPVEVFKGIGTTTDPNEVYSGERCTAKGCDHKKKYGSTDGAQLSMMAGK